MPLSDKNAEPSPFSNEGLNARKKLAFNVVAFLAAFSFLCMAYGIYIGFLKNPDIQATFYLTDPDKAVQKSALIEPHPPEKKAVANLASSENTHLIKELEKEKKTVDETAVVLRELVGEEQQTPVPENPKPLPLKPDIQKLQQEKDIQEQQKLLEIANLQKQRDEAENKKIDILNNLESALATFKEIKSSDDSSARKNKQAQNPDKSETNGKTEKKAPNTKNVAVSEPVKNRVSGAGYEYEVPQPDLIQTNLIDSLPDFALIKKPMPANAIPLHIITPLPELSEDSRYGKLPVKKDDRSPFLAYSHQVALPPQTPYVAILFSGLGKRTNATEAAINTLPDTVSLSFSPYADKLHTYIENARKTGHETLLDLPMQQGVFPDTDPGPLGLVSGLPEQENRKRLHKVLGQNVAIIGITAASKENFSYSGSQRKPFYEEILDRGLIYIDGTDDPRMPKFPQALRPDVHIAEDFHRAAIRARLEQARQIALKKGSAFVRVETVPITLLVVEEWMKSFAPTEEKPVAEISFVPLSYYVQQKEARK